MFQKPKMNFPYIFLEAVNPINVLRKIKPSFEISSTLQIPNPLPYHTYTILIPIFDKYLHEA